MIGTKRQYEKSGASLLLSDCGHHVDHKAKPNGLLDDESPELKGKKRKRTANSRVAEISGMTQRWK